MAFGKEQNQNNEAISPNNYCGGFAMCAVLNDISDSGEKAPMDIYNEIQEQHQQELPTPLTDVINKMRAYGNDTSICLPSSLVLFAETKGLVAELAYSEQLHFEPAVINAEIARCPEVIKKFADDNAVLDYFSGKDVAYCLVLVNSCHWIAMKRKSDNKRFSVYDPGTGGKTELEGKDELIAYLKEEYSNAGELIIMLNH